MNKLEKIDKNKLFEEKKRSLLTIISGYTIKKEMLELFESSKKEKKKYRKKINNNCGNALNFEKNIKNDKDLMELTTNFKMINDDYVKLVNEMYELNEKMAKI